jgi:hypothetical protein
MLPSARFPWLTDAIYSIAPDCGPVVSANARSYIAEGPPTGAALRYLMYDIWQMGGVTNVAPSAACVRRELHPAG